MSNLTVEGSIHPQPDNSSYTKFVGGISGYNMGLIINCTSNVNIIIEENISSQYTYIGGISGYASGPIINSKNLGTLTGLGNSMGIGGLASFNSSDLIGCQNYGDVIVPDGYAGSFTYYNGKNIIGCYNVGNVTDYTTDGESTDSKFIDHGYNAFGSFTGSEMKAQATVDAVNEIFLKYKNVFPNEKYIYRYTNDTENINNGYPILNLSIVTTVSADLSLSSGLSLDDCDINEASLPYG